MERSIRLHCLLWGLLFLLVGCSSVEQRVLLEVDGQRRWLPATGVETVADLLAANDVQLEGNDRVEPPSYTLLEPEMLVRVIRVREREVQEEQVLPFRREVRRDATLAQGESRIAQLGKNGSERLTLRVTLENGVEVEREVIHRETIQEPTSEVLVVGTRGTGEAVPFKGLIVYLAQGNAWVMRGDSTQKWALTRTGDLDGHVFTLSPDGQWLLFTREPLGGASGQGGPLNTLWLVNTIIANDEPRSLDIDSVLWAGWRPCPAPATECPLQVAYSTAERVPNPPGWRAHNDLYRFDLSEEGARGAEVPLLQPSNALFGWWGRSWSWSPDGQHIAWGDGTRLGTVEVETGQEQVLAEFVPYESHSSWVWTPQIAWLPTGRGFLATIHRSGETASAVGQQGAGSETSERFDLLRIPLSDERPELLVEAVGPFAMPQWLDSMTYFYGQAEDRTSSLTSRYDLMVRRGNSEPRQLFPAPGQPGVDTPWVAWNPLDQALIAVWQEDLYLIPLDPSRPARPLTSEGGASRPQWTRIKGED